MVDKKQLTIIVRVEPGCLGPQGAAHIARFCEYAHDNIGLTFRSIFIWNVVPRSDNSLPELDFSISGKKLNRDQASRYLELFDHDINDLEQKIFDRIPDLIDQYFGR